MNGELRIEGAAPLVATDSSAGLPDGMWLVGDAATWDQALVVRADTSSADMRKGLALVHHLGLEPLGEEECEPDLLDDGSVRIWLVPTAPSDPFEYNDNMEPIA
ncbi:hypothetical protein [Streptomyces sp. NPDC090021]|uniref:hypothetical protein n=1 Tax=Streptomyces sp. NPDC090021 TaxID=3365919 RepID=UPI003828F4A5